MKRFFLKNLPSLLLSAAGLLAPASLRAQFLGYTSPQTVSQKVFTAQTTAAVTPNASPFPCTPVNGTPCGIPNLGQSVHSVTYTITNPCVTGFSMTLRMEATNDGATWFAISEDAADQNSGNVQGATTAGLTAIGSYPAYRLNLVQISCASGQTPAITAFYSGTPSASPTAVGAFYQSSPYRKLIVQNSPTTSAAGLTAVTINAPNGNTAGALYISCFVAASGASTACPSGMSVSITAFIAFGGGGGGNIVAGTNSYLVSASVSPIIQVFSVPAVSMTFSFSGAGTAGTSWSIFYLSNSTPTSSFNADPCASPGSVKKTAFQNITTATTTALVSPGQQQTVYICGFTLNMAATGSTADTLLFEQGSGGTCTTPVAISPTYTTGTLAAGAFALAASGNSTIFSSTPGQGVCALTTVGTTPTIAVSINYVQQ